MTARELMALRSARIAEAKAIAGAPELTDEKRAKFDALMNEAETMAGDIRRLQTVETEDAALEESVGTRAARSGEPSAPNLNLKAPRGDTEERAFMHYLRTGDASRELRASNATDLNIGTQADGGYLVPVGLYNKIIAKRNETMLAPKLGVTLIPGKGTTVQVPYDNGTANEFVSTNEAATFDLDGPAFGRLDMTLVDYTKRMPLSYQLIRDEDARLEDYLSNYVGRAYAKTHNNLMVAAALAGGTTFALAAAAAATDLDIPGLVYTLPDGYEDNAAWLMRRATEGSYRALKGSVFQFIDTPQGQEKRLWGYPVYNTASAEAIATGKKSLLFGNWEFMLYRESPALTMLRDPYTSAGSGQVNIYWNFATVYKVALAEAIRYGTHP